MAGDSALSVRKLTINDIITKTTAVAYKRVVLSDTASVTIDISTMDASKLAILIDRPAGAKNPTILISGIGSTAGGSTAAKPLFFTGGQQGNISQLTTEAGEYVAIVETARCKDTSGNLNITKDSVDTVIVYVQAILLP